MKKWIRGTLILALMISILSLVACSTSSTDTKDSKTSTEKQKTIGIVQIVEHPSLDASRQGFIDALKANGYEDGKQIKLDYQNAQGQVQNLTTISQKFVNDKVDLIFAIATPSAQAAAQQTKDIPILITAVTDPVTAGVVKSMDKPGTNVTGTTDMNPVKDQLALVKEVKPSAKKVGIIYNTGEANSEVQIKIAKEVAPELGLNLELIGITNSSEVKQAADALAAKVDAIYVPTDNTVVSALDSVLKVAEQTKIPVVVGEGDSVKKGGLITYGLDYYKLGYQTGEMAVKILKGEAKPQDMPIETQKDMKLIINKKAAKSMGVELSEELLKKADEVIE
ncbi:ABC transporter substrate-binding protein [Tepidibacillus fermentans]|uniref:Putative ABC transport system substrate-binding protein n=1 Tax=Tepidibacillus fermentans TaxID=1281767 RepID=A0A4V2USR3_9BACI|nr:ABC transporter substrate-binding protein [Tepidibacillus fermentans]TCS82442.1 putative ABC transport system substrate-binding protein [Tepidibacillus fermentans]